MVEMRRECNRKHITHTIPHPNDALFHSHCCTANKLSTLRTYTLTHAIIQRSKASIWYTEYLNVSQSDCLHHRQVFSHFYISFWYVITSIIINLVYCGYFHSLERTKTKANNQQPNKLFFFIVD